MMRILQHRAGKMCCVSMETFVGLNVLEDRFISEEKYCQRIQ